LRAAKKVDQRVASTGRSLDGGGSAAQKGIAFQNRVAAWVAVRILAEQAASPPWDLPVNTTLECVRCETEQPIDDVLVGTSEDGCVFIAVKHRLTLDRGEGSEFALVVEQLVLQFASQHNAAADQTANRRLDPDRDRFVLLLGPNSSAPIRVSLLAVLNRLRSLAPGQALECAAINKEERRAFSVFREHVARSLQRISGLQLVDSDLREFIAFVRIHTLDVDDGGSAEREAKNFLRSVILRDVTQADVAWNTLVQTCAQFACDRAGGDRHSLQRVLLAAGIWPQALHSYRADIERLRVYCRNTVALLADLSSIQVGQIEVKIRRRSTQVLREAAEDGSLIVVGEPGAGKSGALHDLVVALQNEQRDVVFLAVDRLEAQSLAALREEIGLSHDLLEVLENWHGSQPAFLVIDALDAAKSDKARRTLLDLILQTAEAASRWRIVASIRKFDLRYNQNIRHHFSGKPPTEFHDRDFSGVRHVNIPGLQDEELYQIEAQSEELAHLVKIAAQPLRDMLRVPFNLRLMGELLGGGIAAEELTSIRTQIELLDRYWLQRVIRSDGQGDARERVLRHATGEMVQSRTLRANRDRVVCDTGTSPILEDILSSNILSEWPPSPTAKPDRYVLAFAHHVLFDYAVARLLLRGDRKGWVEQLALEPELLLAIRPSLVLHFQHTWFSDETRSPFWDLVSYVIRAPAVREIGKLVGPGVAAELATCLGDVRPLLSAVQSPDTTVRDAADQALRHVVGTVLSAPADLARPLVGDGAGPWCELLEQMTERMRPPIAYTARMLLCAICEHPQTLTPGQRRSAGLAARRLLEFARDQTPRDSWLVIHALQAVCRTFESAPDESAALIRRCLQPAHLAEHGFEEMHWLAQEVEQLVYVNPTLVEDIYQAAFTHQELREDRTPFGTSRILSMTSTRRQDYEMGLWKLAQVYPIFLSRAPARATRALIVAMDAYVAREPLPVSEKIRVEVFDFGGRSASIRIDYSCIWHQGVASCHDNPVRMLHAFENHLTQLAHDAGRATELREIVDTLIAHNRLAVVWGHLLASGTQAPDTLGLEIRPLAWAIPVLICPDTTAAASDFLGAVFHRLDPQDRRRVEQAILSIPQSTARTSTSEKERLRNRLLGSLEPGALVSEEARQLRDELRLVDNVPVDERCARSSAWTSYCANEGRLVDTGVPVTAERNRRIQALERVMHFAP